MTIMFSVPGKPQGKARARTVRNQRTGRVHSFTPQKTVNYESLIRACYRQAGGKYFGDKAYLNVSIAAKFPIPKSFSKQKRLSAFENKILPTVKPDCDNIIKAVLDALNGVAYKDDKQVVSVECFKFYTPYEESIHISITEVHR